MPTILGFAALFLLATDALNMDLSLLPGVSAKNLIIYLIAVMLALRMVVSRSSIMVAGQMQGAFIIADRLRHRHLAHRGAAHRVSALRRDRERPSGSRAG